LTTRPGDSNDRDATHSHDVATDDPPDMVTLRCNDSVDRLLRRAVARSEAHGLDVFEVIDHSGDAADLGLAIPDAKLVLFSNPLGAAELMLAKPRIAIDLPIKLLIYEDKAGEVFVSYNSLAYLASRYRLTDSEADVLQIVETIALQTRSNP
jgi:uncharacterized protein (DUF302 family)